jgi:O-methyltransferase
VIACEATDLVVFDLPFGAVPEFVPHPDVDLESVRQSSVHAVSRLRNSWWFTKRELGFSARAVYADIYNFPPDLGKFDVTILASILLHLSNPFRALQSAAAVTEDTVIVTMYIMCRRLPMVAKRLHCSM